MTSFDDAKKPKSEFPGSHLSNSPAYSLLAVYMPVTALIAYIFLLQTLISADLNAIILIIGGGISAAAASFYFDFMKDVKASRAAANIRGAIIISALIYFLISIFNFNKPWSEKFIPDFINIPSVICALYAWISVIVLKTLFSARGLFETITEKYEGEKLQEMLYEESGLLQYTDENINKVQLNYYMQLAIIFILALTCIILKNEIPILLYIHLIILLVGGVCIHGLFAIIKWEQYYAGEGINLSGYDRIKRILAIILLSFSGLIIAGLLASEKSIIPFSLITGFFAWLFSFLRGTPVDVELQRPESLHATENMDMGFSPFEEKQTSPFWSAFAEYFWIFLKYALILFAIALFIRFMISPLLNRGYILKDLTFRQKLFLIIKEWYRRFINAISSFLAHIRGNKQKKLSKYSDEDINRASNMIFSVYSSLKKRDAKLSVTLFARLIIWGADVRNVAWKPSLAPGEYCDLLAAHRCKSASLSEKNSSEENNLSLQKINKGILRCASLFEKALYSADVLSDAEKKEFKCLIEEITSSAE